MEEEGEEALDRALAGADSAAKWLIALIATDARKIAFYGRTYVPKTPGFVASVLSHPRLQQVWIRVPAVRIDPWFYHQLFFISHVERPPAQSALAHPSPAHPPHAL